ncbi:PASTA domain-containing protein [Breoghania sp.]|uniref:PASTA domain-containing protein n=1 Tax=Breoghania sp. TaxID=2065378 RepID=UPI002AA83305|nr:PASTA domain-containing protein [Breoghania sp.]
MSCAALLAFAAMALATSPAPATAAQIQYDSDRQKIESFVKAVEAAHPFCMPSAYPLLVNNYAYRLVESVFAECAMDPGNLPGVVKNVSLVIGASVPSPVQPAFAATLADEFSTDAVKCTLKAFVEASGSLSNATKARYKSRIDAAAMVKDWYGFAGDIPEIADPDKLKSAQATVNSVTTIYDRASEARSVSGAFTQALRAGVQGASDYVFGERENTIERFEWALKTCRFTEVETLIKKIETLTEQECASYGEEYRVVESELHSHVYRNRVNLENTPRLADSPADHTYDQIKSKLDARERQLRRFIETVKEFPQFQKDLQKKQDMFEKQEKTYLKRYETAGNALDKAGGCYAVLSVTDVAASFDGLCGTTDYLETAQSRIPSPQALAAQFNHLARQRSQEWWSELDRIRGDYRACRISQGESKLQELNAQIRANPSVLLEGDTCREIHQGQISEEISKLTIPQYCLEREVPQVARLSASRASDLLYEHGFVPGGLNKGPVASENDTPQTVSHTDPPIGSMQKPNTVVNLFLYTEAATQDAVMPDVIGKSETDAGNLVRAADLVPAIDRSKPADELEKKPGHVHSASHKGGDVLPAGAAVTLHVWGPRPTVEIPRLRGKSVADAQGILNGLKLYPTGPGLGDPATDDFEPGQVSTTDPEIGSSPEIFTQVQILIFGPRPQQSDEEQRPIPEVSGKTPSVAAGILVGEDDFFAPGAVTLGNPAPEGTEPGTIYLTTPAEKSLAPRGTVVSMKIYGPRKAHTETRDDESENGNTDGGDDIANNVTLLDPTSPPCCGPACLGVPGADGNVPRKPDPRCADRTRSGNTQADGGSDDDLKSWFGVWSLKGQIAKGMKLNTIMEVLRSGNDVYVVISDREGKHSLRSPAAIDGNVLTNFPPDFRDRSQKRKPSAFDFGISAVTSNLTGALAEFVKSLKFTITRNGNVCSTDFSVTNHKTRKKIEFSADLTCERLGPGSGSVSGSDN